MYGLVESLFCFGFGVVDFSFQICGPNLGPKGLEVESLQGLGAPGHLGLR